MSLNNDKIIKIELPCLNDFEIDDLSKLLAVYV